MSVLDFANECLALSDATHPVHSDVPVAAASVLFHYAGTKKYIHALILTVTLLIT